MARGRSWNVMGALLVLAMAVVLGGCRGIGSSGAERGDPRRESALVDLGRAEIIDHGPSRDFIVHQVACAANVPGLENVANLDRLPETGAWVVALPMKIAGGPGAPVRIVALLPRG